MTAGIPHSVAPYLLLAELGAALFAGTAASAEERITLEVIGAVRMAGPEVVRSADAATGRTRDGKARAASAGHSLDGMAANRN